MLEIWTQIDVGTFTETHRRTHKSEFWIYKDEENGHYRCMLSADIAKRRGLAGKRFNLKVCGKKFGFQKEESGQLILREKGYIGAKSLASAIAQFTDATVFHAEVVGDRIEFWPREVTP